MTGTTHRDRKAEMRRYIALEGIDGAGKTSVQAALRARLESVGQDVVCVREPGGTPVGKALRSVLLHGPEVAPWAEALMFAADRVHLVTEVVRPALARGAWVLSDRSVYSSLAYQGVGRGLGMERVRRVNEPGLAGTWPDLVVLLTVTPRTGLARQESGDRIGSEGSSLLSVVAEAFDELSRQEPARFVEVNAERSLDRVMADVWAAVGASS